MKAQKSQLGFIITENSRPMFLLIQTCLQGIVLHIHELILFSMTDFEDWKLLGVDNCSKMSTKFSFYSSFGNHSIHMNAWTEDFNKEKFNKMITSLQKNKMITATEKDIGEGKWLRIQTFLGIWYLKGINKIFFA